jgi:hypothetical protein
MAKSVVKLMSMCVAASIQVALAVQPASAQPPKPLDAKVIQAWKNAGAEVGWMGADGFSLKEKPGYVPAFRIKDWQAGQFAALPVPKEAFGLDLRRGPPRNGLVRELAEMKSLQALSIAGTSLTDRALKDLAGWLKNLETLHVDSAKVTDAGLKELAGLKKLQTLVHSNTQVTAAGVAELQKALPQCKIITRSKVDKK